MYGRVGDEEGVGGCVKVVDTSVTSQLNPLADSGHRRHTSLNVVIGIRRHTFGIYSWLGQARGEER